MKLAMGFVLEKVLMCLSTSTITNIMVVNYLQAPSSTKIIDPSLLTSLPPLLGFQICSKCGLKNGDSIS